MIKALAVSGGVALVALIALFMAPAGSQVTPLSTLLGTVLMFAVYVALGQYVVGAAAFRRPPHAIASRVMLLILGAVILEVLAMGFSPNWSIAIAVWYLALFGAGAALNRWCDAPERYAVFVSTFIVVATSLILMVIAALSPRTQADLSSNAVLVSLWPNVTRIAGNPADAAWTWLAWRVLDRLRPPEKRPKSANRVETRILPTPKKTA
jgi:hypothetical protein